MPQVSCSATLCIQGRLAWKKEAMVWGKAMIDEAKITGMTPAVLTRSGRCVVWPP